MKKEKFNVVGIGEVLWDLYPEGKKIGGAPANFAYHVTQMGANGIIISAVGNDDLGKEIMDSIKSQNIGNFIQVSHSFPTGVVEVRLDQKGVPVFNIIENVAWDYIGVPDEAMEIVSQADAICYGTLAQRMDSSRHNIRRLVKEVVKNEHLTVFDINLRRNFYDKNTIEKSLKYTNVLKLNSEELKILSTFFKLPDGEIEACKNLIDRFELNVIALTKGEEGSYIFDNKDESFLASAKVDIVDTTGAGDAFTAALVMGLLNERPIREIHQAAVDLSAFVCSHRGATVAHLKKYYS